MKKIAIIGASYLQLPLVKKAKDMGLEVHCFAWAEGAVCKELADFFYPISIIEKEEILEICKKVKIDGICTIASDVAAPTVAYVANAMGLVGNDYAAAVRANNKFLMREAFMKAGVPCPKYMMITPETLQTPEVIDGLRNFRYPMIVKPSDRSGSLGVSKIEIPTDFYSAVNTAIEVSFKKQVMVEEFIEGREISVEFISYKGIHYPLQITDKVTTEAPHFVELAHHQPSTLPDEMCAKIYTITKSALDALGLTNGASHSEYKITCTGRIFVMEIGGRMGGDFIGSDLVRLSTGYDFLNGVIDVALGQFVTPKITENSHSGVYFLCKETEWLLPIMKNYRKYPQIVDCQITDDKLRNVRCSADRSGYAIYKSDSRFNICNQEKKRLLILGAGRGQVGLIKSAKELGFETIVASYSRNFPGVEIADEFCDVDISHPIEVKNAARLLNIDGVATSCLDTGIQSLGCVCDDLGLQGITESSAKMCNNKLLMKERFCKNGISTARFYRIENENDIEDALKILKFPLIVKAVDLQGSNGIYIARSRDEVLLAYKSIKKLTHKNYCIIEEFIEGVEFGAQAFVYNGEVIFVLTHGDITHMGNTAVPVGHYVPFNLSQNLVEQTERLVRDGIKALELNNCAVNVDLIIKDNKIYIIEMTGRVGANCLPELVSIYYGIDYYKMIAMCAVGFDPRLLFNKRNKLFTAGLSMMIQSDKSGIIDNIVNTNSMKEKGIYDITFFVSRGDSVRKFFNSKDCIGQVIVKGETIANCHQTMERVIDNIQIKLSK